MTTACEARWIRTVDPVIEPLTLREVKDHLRIAQAEGDQTLDRYIQAAREAAESALNRGLLTQTWTLTLPSFPEVIWLPQAAPLQNDPLAVPSTAPVVAYYDVDGVLQTVAAAAYVVDTVSRPGRLLRAPRQVWPPVQSDRGNPITVTYVVGWRTRAEVPERIKQGLRLYIGSLDADRDGLDPNSDRARMAARACWDDRVEWIEADV